MTTETEAPADSRATDVQHQPADGWALMCAALDGNVSPPKPLRPGPRRVYSPRHEDKAE